MTVGDIQHALEAWAPRELAWERDNVGLLVGSPSRKTRRILVSLDVTDDVLEEARSRRCDFIITHHPLLYHPLRTIGDDRIGRLVQELLRSNIALFAAHTNLDFTESGVSFALAEQIGVQNPEVLEPRAGALNKITVFVPRDHADSVMNAMESAGAGSIGKYDACSFRCEGVGTFRAGAGAHPYIGKVGRTEFVPEVRLETIAPRWRTGSVIAAVKNVHPYEEVAYDVYPLENMNHRYGAGAIGTLETELSLSAFLQSVRTSLRAVGIRYVGNPRRRIRRVAVCGGAGGELLARAIQCGADAFVTADLTYHVFERADGRIALIDAGHYETEHPIVRKIVDRLKRQAARMKQRIHIFASRRSQNPIRHHPS